MQTHLLLREFPRALALRPTVLEEAPSGVLVFEEYAGSNNRAVAKLFAPSEFEDSQWRILNSRPVFGCLGLITIQSGGLQSNECSSQVALCVHYVNFELYTFFRVFCCYCH